VASANVKVTKKLFWLGRALLLSI